MKGMPWQGPLGGGLSFKNTSSESAECFQKYVPDIPNLLNGPQVKPAIYLMFLSESDYQPG